MTLTYRVFDQSIEDAAGILAVEAACWDESPHTPQTLQTLLDAPEHSQVCWLAEKEGKIVGFMHAFLTLGRSPTWELDLLAVHPNARCQGIATQLIRYALNSAPPSVTRSRALIQPKNVASAGAFKRAGFTTDATMHGIFEYDVQGVASSSGSRLANVTLESMALTAWTVSDGDQRLSLNLVRTILYDGLWVEGVGPETGRILIDAALVHAANRKLDTVGLVLSISNSDGVDLVGDLGFTSIGDYHVWMSEKTT